MQNPAENLLRLYRKCNAIDAAIGLMNWDRQVLMPAGGAKARSAQVAILTRMSHELLTSDELRRALDDARIVAEPGSDLAAMTIALQREVDIETKLPAELVMRKATVSSEGYEVWKLARSADDFPAMAPYYAELFNIAAETAALLGYREHIYDPLIDLYDEGSTHSTAKTMFEAIKNPIVDLVRRIQTEGRPVTDDALQGDFDKEALRRFAEQTIQAIGFDMNRGRLNHAPSAFCMHLSCDDVRMTTRASNHIKGVVSSSLHEMGHGLYEQNSPKRWDRTPLAGGASLAIHESQSRCWENIIGRSNGFWRRFLPDLKSYVPQLGSLVAREFYRAINKIEPTFIRVGADELTYNLHILIRFELEVELLTRKLKIADLPDAWNEKYRSYLGVSPPNNSVGCLQDVHWSRGSIGYFPTYAMGNLIGAQIWKTLTAEVPNTDHLMATGNFKPILGWLVDRVYRKARSLTPRGLLLEVTGKPINAEDWLAYSSAKYSDIYF